MTNEIVTNQLVKLARDMGYDVEEQTSFYKLRVGSRAIYISKSTRTPRVDFSGFLLEHPAVHAMAKRTAKKMKLGRVQGQLDFNQPEGLVLEAFRTALAILRTPEEQVLPEPLVLGEPAAAPRPVLQHAEPVPVAHPRKPGNGKRSKFPRARSQHPQTR